MASFVFDKETGELVDKQTYYERKFAKQAHLVMTKGNQMVTMNFISDTMEPTRHMANGKYYTSKAAFRAATKAAGCIEIGNDTKYLTKKRAPVKLDRRKRREDIRKAIHDVKNGNAPRIDQLR